MGPLIILSGPSGCGKSTVIKQLLETSGLPLCLSVSATTRRPRKNETRDVDYHFWTPEEFEAELARGGFLEWAEVHGKRYGTLRSEVDRKRQQGLGVLLDIDVQGAAQVRRACPDNVSIFLAPPSLAVLEQRLRDRGTEDEASIRRRLDNAAREMDRQGEYNHVVINDDLNCAVAEVKELIRSSFPAEEEKHAR